MSIAKASLRFCGLFEAELLTELMLRYWGHPLAADRDFRNQLVETATEVLRAAAAGQTFIEGFSGPNMNLVAAVWYAEWNGISPSDNEPIQFAEDREKWLEAVRRALPSCFCNPDFLPPSGQPD